MIKFFRQFRKTFIADGKSSQYFKYAIGEIILVVIGILIALSINTWYANKKTNYDKDLVISKIKEEVKNNSLELEKTNAKNQLISKAFDEYKVFYKGTSSVVIIAPDELAKLRKKYPGFYTVKDSIQLDSGKYQYSGGSTIELDIPELTSIAWKTTQTINIVNEFDYDCLYDLETMYNLQERVEREINKAAEALQKSDIKALFAVLNVLNQLDSQLLENYNKVLDGIDNCR